MLFKKIGRSRPAFYLTAGLVGALMVGSLFVAQKSMADSRYTFVIRGDVMKIDSTNKTAHVYFRHVNSATESDEGQTIEITTRNAKFYKYDAKQKKVSGTFGMLALGDEVVISGRAGGGTYDAAWVVKNDNLVKIKGTVDAHNVSGDYLSIELDSIVYTSSGKAYKPKSFTKSDIVRVYYDSDSVKFTSRDGHAMNADEISNDGEKMTLKNVKVKYGSRFEADAATPVSEIIDGKYL